MLVFNEGVPRSGKSYDAVKNHILPALKAGRRVYARLDGLDSAKIAAYLKMDEEQVRAQLIEVTPLDVKRTLIARCDVGGAGDHSWTIADELKDSLFVVDEAHEFYVASREAIDPGIEQFFALCSKNGMDGVLMSQWYKRLHSSVRARVERKNIFQKLTVAALKGRYNLRMYHSTEPDRFELVDATVQPYDKDIFPLYHGYDAASKNKDVYTAGGTTVWHRLRKYALFVVPLVIVGCYCLFHFLHNGAGLVKTPASSRPLANVSGVPAVAGEVNGSVRIPESHAFHIDEKGMSPEVKYVFDLCEDSRPRLAAVATMAGQTYGVIEWRGGGAGVSDRMTFAQIRSLGVTIEVHPYGAKLVWKGQGVIATAWPVQEDDASSMSAASSAGTPVVASRPTPSRVVPASPVTAVGGDLPSGVGPQVYVPPSWQHTDTTYLPSRGAR